MNDQNEKLLEEWHKQFLFFNVENLDKMHGPILSYMFRSLSRRQIPSVEIIKKALESDFQLKSCGYINCFIEMEHVH